VFPRLTRAKALCRPIRWSRGWDCTRRYKDLLGPRWRRTWALRRSLGRRYSVALTDGGADFTVTVECDLDGDGQRAASRGSKAEPVHRISPNHVY